MRLKTLNTAHDLALSKFAEFIGTLLSSKFASITAETSGFSWDYWPGFIVDEDKDEITGAAVTFPMCLDVSSKVKYDDMVTVWWDSRAEYFSVLRLYESSAERTRDVELLDHSQVVETAVGRLIAFNVTVEIPDTVITKAETIQLIQDFNRCCIYPDAERYYLRYLEEVKYA